MSQAQPTAPPPVPEPGSGTDDVKPTRVIAKRRRLAPRDRAVVITMVTIPTIFVVGLVWVPALGSLVLSFASWSGIGGFDTIEWVGLKNYEDITTERSVDITQAFILAQNVEVLAVEQELQRVLGQTGGHNRPGEADVAIDALVAADIDLVMRCVAALDLRAERPSLDGLGKDHGRSLGEVAGGGLRSAG